MSPTQWIARPANSSSGRPVEIDSVTAARQPAVLARVTAFARVRMFSEGSVRQPWWPQPAGRRGDGSRGLPLSLGRDRRRCAHDRSSSLLSMTRPSRSGDGPDSRLAAQLARANRAAGAGIASLPPPEPARTIGLMSGWSSPAVRAIAGLSVLMSIAALVLADVCPQAAARADDQPVGDLRRSGGHVGLAASVHAGQQRVAGPAPDCRGRIGCGRALRRWHGTRPGDPRR